MVARNGVTRISIATANLQLSCRRGALLLDAVRIHTIPLVTFFPVLLLTLSAAVAGSLTSDAARKFFRSHNFLFATRAVA